jgi:polysaccharide export outer membrane protein
LSPIALVACACVLFISSLAHAQNSTSDPPDPQLKTNPAAAIRSFEPAVDDEYRLGKGDDITVDFAGRTDLQAKLVVGPDGRVSLPLAGDIRLAGLTRPEAAKAIDSALSAYYNNLSAEVTVTKYTANRVLLLGAVEHPGSILFDGPPTLLEALTRGGLPLGIDRKTAQIPDQCAIYRGNDQVLWVQLKELIESGNPLADMRLQRDDVIYVPNPTERFVSVLGEVQHPGAIPLTNASTLASVIAQAGGTSPAAGSKPHIQIVDPKTGTSRLISMNDLLNPTKSLEVTLHPGEIIFIPQSGFYHATYFLERLSPLTTLATLAIVDGAL